VRLDLASGHFPTSIPRESAGPMADASILSEEMGICLPVDQTYIEISPVAVIHECSKDPANWRSVISDGKVHLKEANITCEIVSGSRVHVRRDDLRTLRWL
jgi:hypothetical protein